MNKVVFVISVLLSVFLYGCKNVVQKAKQIYKPNIVIIFIDDMGYADPGCFGATAYQTPNIDKLAENGMRFTDFYVSEAVCSASRASLLTGCYSERVGVSGALTPGETYGLNPEETTIANILKKQGYVTAAIGKWHLGHLKPFLPLKQGFDEYFGLPYSNDMWPVYYDGTPAKKGMPHSNYPPLPLMEGDSVIDTVATLVDQGQLTKMYTQRAVEFIEKNKDNPFFLYLPHSMVHVPIAVSNDFKGKSGKGLFADVMLELDWSVQQIVKALKENGIYNNTLVIFTSDNGPWLNFGNNAGSAFPLREGKGTMWEGGSRVSAIMQWPEVIKPGTECNNIASTIDVLPTLAAITGAPLPERKIDGVNILPLLKGEKGANPRNEFIYYYHGNLIAVRRGDWKLVFPHFYRSYQGVKPGKDGFPGPYARGVVKDIELYNLKEDISETNNVAADHPEIVRELKLLGDSVRQDLGDRLTNIKGTGRRQPGRIYQKAKTIHNKAMGKNIVINSEYAWEYSADGDKTLIDGKLGSLDFKDGHWLGFHGKDVEVIVDLENETEISKVDCGFLINQGSWILGPEKITISFSNDGKKFSNTKTISYRAEAKQDKVSVKHFSFDVDIKSRFVKLNATGLKTCPKWHIGAGQKSWLFLDEIVIQ